MYAYRVTSPNFHLDGKEYKRGDLIEGSDAQKIEKENAHLQHFVVRIPAPEAPVAAKAVPDMAK